MLTVVECPTSSLISIFNTFNTSSSHIVLVQVLGLAPGQVFDQSLTVITMCTGDAVRQFRKVWGFGEPIRWNVMQVADAA